MLKHTLHVLWRERRQNVGLWIELTLVVTAVWIITNLLLMMTDVRWQPLGFNTDDVFRVSFEMVEPQSPRYDSSSKSSWTSLQRCVERLQSEGAVESVSVSMNSMPFVFNGNAQPIGCDTALVGMTPWLIASPGFAEVFGVRDIHGSQEKVVEALERGDVVVSRSLAEKLAGGRDIEWIIGKQVYIGGDSATAFERARVGALVEDARRLRVMGVGGWFLTNGLMNDRMSRVSVPNVEVCVRVSGAYAKGFEEYFAQTVRGRIRDGNVFAGDATSLLALRNSTERDTNNLFRLITSVASLLLVFAFLGVVGTFWMRMQQRRKEVAIRLTLGDRPKVLLWRYVGEGMLMLAFTLVVVVPVFLFVVQGSYDGGETVKLWLHLLGLLLVYVLVGLMIVIGVAIPAWRAVRVNPAIAIRED